MYSKKIRAWRHFHNDILSVNRTDADLLEIFLSRTRISKAYLNAMEIVDLQKYRLVKQRNKVACLLQLPSADRVFLFPVNLN